MESKGLIKVVDGGEQHTAVSVGTAAPCLNVFKDEVEGYRKDARKLLDAWSRDFNRIGISARLAALLYEVLGENYYGKSNK